MPEGSEVAYFALGCFWGAEKLFWNTPGVTNTAVGYAGGFTPNPTYQEVCSARTGHTEIVKVSYDPAKISYEKLLKIFFENHDPYPGDAARQRRRHPVPIGDSHDLAGAAEKPPSRYVISSRPSSVGRVTGGSPPRSRRPATSTYAEDYHQQYLDKNPFG
jgi:peptide-methionine (S)-S-oxide reductase